MNRPAARQQPRSRFFQRMVWWVAAVPTLLIPLYVSPAGEDLFRMPKELVFRAEAIILGVLLLAATLLGEIKVRTLSRDRTTTLLLISSSAVALLTVALSTNVAISARSFAYFATCAITFLGTYLAVGPQSLRSVVFVGIGSGVPNALLALVQRIGWWNPFDFPAEIPQRMRITALIGNPNDVGAYLAICCVVGMAYAIASRKLSAILATVLLLAGVFASDALTAIGAVLAAMLTMAFGTSRRLALVLTTLVIVVGLASLTGLPSLRARAVTLATAFRTHDYFTLTTDRIVSFTAAWTMFHDHPVTGVGPGTFKWHYLPYRLRVIEHHPQFYLKNLQNFGEVHSDHLQILAEEGIVGYAVFALILGVLGWQSLAPADEAKASDRTRFIRLLSLPLAVAIAILAVTGFPLELSAVTSCLVFFMACIRRWSSDVDCA
jgi:O-antigen ligase